MSFELSTRPRLYSLSFFILFIGFVPLYSQNDNLNSQVLHIFETYPEKEALLMLSQLVDNKCDTADACKVELYKDLREPFEINSQLNQARLITAEAIRFCKETERTYDEALMHIDQFRFYDALGIYGLSLSHLDTASNLLEAMGDSNALLRVKHYHARLSTIMESPEKGAAEMEELVISALNIGDTLQWLSTCFSLIHVYISSGNYDRSLYHFDKVLNYLNNHISDNNVIWIQRFYQKKGQYFLGKKERESALIYLDSALSLSAEANDNYTNVHLLLERANLLNELGRYDEAFAYLEKGKLLAKEESIIDLLLFATEIEMDVALNTGNFKRAFLASQEANGFDSIRQSRLGSFNLENYYLRLERSQAEQRGRQEAQSLRISELKFRITAGIVLTVSVLFIILYWAFRRQKASSLKLKAQNNLINRQKDDLKKLDEAKAQFYSKISHELRSPLTLVLAPLKRLFKSNQLNQEQETLLLALGKGADQLNDLIEKLTDFGKIKDKELELSLKSVRLTAFFSHYLSQFDSLAEDKGINYNYFIHFEDHIQAQIDPDKCRQVLLNLLSNAFNYTLTSGKIEVDISLDGSDQLYVKVVDSGIGISEKDQLRIFDRYFQSTDPKKAGIGGIGMGLSLCHEYAALMGGSISVKSKVNHGSEFILSLSAPILESNLATNEHFFQNHRELGRQQDLEKADQGASNHILVVEDSIDLQRYIYLLLSDTYRVTTSSNGSEALKVLKEHQDIELVVSDLMMPVMDGQTLLRNLKTMPATKDLPVIMLTARTEVETKLQALRFGLDDYITKPFNEQELLIRIQNLLNRKAVRKKHGGLTLTAEKKDPTSPKKTQLNLEDQEWLGKLNAYLKLKSDDPSLRIPDVAQALSVSESVLFRKVKRLIGITPKQYLDELRLDRARGLLENKEVTSIKQLAKKVGYADPRTFSRSYFKRFGKQPSEY